MGTGAYPLFALMDEWIRTGVEPVYDPLAELKAIVDKNIDSK